jgi:hypothetical protein
VLLSITHDSFGTWLRLRERYGDTDVSSVAVARFLNTTCGLTVPRGCRSGLAGAVITLRLRNIAYAWYQANAALFLQALRADVSAYLGVAPVSYLPAPRPTFFLHRASHDGSLVVGVVFWCFVVLLQGDVASSSQQLTSVDAGAARAVISIRPYYPSANSQFGTEAFEAQAATEASITVRTTAAPHPPSCPIARYVVRCT